VTEDEQYIATADAITFHVEQLHSHARTMPALESLREHIHYVLDGHVLRLMQKILLFFEGSSLKLSVSRLADNCAAMQLAFAMGTHKRLGENSPLLHVNSKLLHTIACDGFQDGATSCNISCSTTIIVLLDHVWMSVSPCSPYFSSLFACACTLFVSSALTRSCHTRQGVNKAVSCIIGIMCGCWVAGPRGLGRKL